MKYLAIIVLLLISACQTTSLQNNFYSSGAKDSEASIEILQPLRVPPNSARVYFQNGKMLTNTAIDLYEVNCEVEINTVSEQSQGIAPGLFRITSIRQEESPIVMFRSMMTASLRTVWDNDSPVDIKRYYYFHLVAQDPDSSSQVRGVICRGVQEQPYLAELPTLQEMKLASGEYLRFNF
jgi:hypothetical protein